MAENKQFIDLTEVFSESVKVSEKPHTWWRDMLNAFAWDYDYGAKYETQVRTKEISVPVDGIAKIEEANYDGGVKAALVLKTGATVYTQEDKATIRQKMTPPKPAQ